MLVGVPKEIKNHEYRVGLLPSSVHELIDDGHRVIVESNAGHAIGFDNASYEAIGAEIVVTPQEIFHRAELVVKVKEPQPIERQQLHESQTLFTYLHLAPDLSQTRDLMNSGATCIAYETVTDSQGGLPLLAPMSEVAGRMSVQAGAFCLEKTRGGSGVLLGGIPGTHQGRLVILGGGVVGQNAAQMAVGLGARVTIIDKSLEVLRHLDARFSNQVQTLYATKDVIIEETLAADLVIGAVLVPGASAPKLITREMVSQMKQGSVLLDVAIDQGGCFETSKPTTHADPTYIVDEVVHYCVANMPGGLARTSTAALNNATLPFVLQLANNGARAAMIANPHLRHGLNIYQGNVTNLQVSEAHDIAYSAPEDLLIA
jgi:alanine dehydrogenase